MEPAQNKSVDDKAEANHWLLALLIPLVVPSVCAGFAALMLPGRDAWLEHANPQDKVLVCLLAFVTLLLWLFAGFKVLIDRRARKQATKRKPRPTPATKTAESRGRRGLLYVLFFAPPAALLTIVLRKTFPDKAGKAASTDLVRTLIVECDDDVHSISLRDHELTLQIDASGKRRFVKNDVVILEPLVLQVSRMLDQCCWTQQAEATLTNEDATVSNDATSVYRLTGLDWSRGRFLSSADLDGTVHARTVLTYAPSEGCRQSLAGRSLAAGTEVFRDPEHKIKDAPSRAIDVTSIEDTESLPTHEDYVAIVGSYDSNKTSQLLKYVESRGAHDCGPILSFSSAVSLRASGLGKVDPSDPSTPRLFRLTSDNKTRAKDLCALLKQVLQKDAASRSIHVIYDDDSGVGGEVQYARDQARELEHAFDTDLRSLDIDVRWTRFRNSNGSGTASISFTQGAPSQPYTASDFESFGDVIAQIRAHMRAKTCHITRVVLIARDHNIVQFAQALRSSYPEGTVARDIVLHVPSPREIFEGAWKEDCPFDPPCLPEDLDGAIVVAPYSYDQTCEGWKLRNRWHAFHPEKPVASRAERMFDALMIIESAVRTLDDRLQNERRCLDVHTYRRELRKLILSTRIRGTSSIFAFEPNGDMITSNTLSIYRSGAGLQELPVLKQLA